MATHLSVRNLAKGFGGTRILHEVSLDIAEGEFIALVGPSGCGKSTLLRLIAGLDQPDGGQILIGGDDVTARRAADRDVAMVFQSYALYPHLTARQNMAVPLAMRRLSALQRMSFVGGLMPGRKAIMAAITAEIERAAEALHITPLLDRKPSAMSGGQRQRVALGRALVRQPKAFLMDEPLSNLDAALRVHTRSEIVDLHRRLGVTTVYVTHDQEEALSMADRVAVMQGGRLLQVADPRTIYHDPDHLDVAEFIGNPRINVFHAEVSAKGRIEREGVTLGDGLPQHAGETVSVAVRPEHIVLVREPGPMRVPVRLDRLEFLGAEVIAHLILGGRPLLGRLGPDSDQAAALAGGMLYARFEPAHLLMFDASGARVRHG